MAKTVWANTSDTHTRNDQSCLKCKQSQVYNNENKLILFPFILKMGCNYKCTKMMIMKKVEWQMMIANSIWNHVYVMLWLGLSDESLSSCLTWFQIITKVDFHEIKLNQVNQWEHRHSKIPLITIWLTTTFVHELIMSWSDMPLLVHVFLFVILFMCYE